MAITRAVIRNVGLGILVILVLAMGYGLVRRVFIHPPVDARIENEKGVSDTEEVIQLQILNGTNIIGIARQTTDYLRRRGFDVVVTENYAHQTEHSFIVQLRRDTLSPKKLAYALGLQDKDIRRELDSTLMLDCSVVLGNDYKKLKPFQ